MRKYSYRLVTAMVLCGLIFSAPRFSAADSKPNPTTQIEKESYSIGYQVGVGMRADNLEIAFDQLVQGLRDAIDKEKPLVEIDEMRTLIVALKKRANAEQLKKSRERIEANAEEARQFLEENKKQAGVVTTASGLQYKVLKEGTGNPPGPQDFVRVNYRGAFIDGTIFDNSYDRDEPIRVRADGVIKGWSEALAMMTPGSEWQIFVPPDLGYGSRGHGQAIPPNKLLVFDVELLGVETGTDAESAPIHQNNSSNR